MPTDAALKLHSVVGSQALQLLCLSSARQTREFAYGILREIPSIDCQSEEGALPEQHQLPVFTAKIAGSLEDELRAATGYGASVFGAAGNALEMLAFGAGAAGARAQSAAAAGADAEFADAWHQRTAQIRGVVETKLMSLFPVALSGAARTAEVDKQLRLFVVLVFVLRNFAEACTKPRRSIWYEYPGLALKTWTLW